MAVVDSYPEAVMQQATTRSNLAATLLRLSQMKPQADAIYQDAMRYLQEALEIYERKTEAGIFITAQRFLQWEMPAI